MKYQDVVHQNGDILGKEGKCVQMKIKKLGLNKYDELFDKKQSDIINK